MVFPLYDDNPFAKPKPPVVTWSLIAINVIVFLVQISSTEAGNLQMTMAYGFTPASLSADIPQAGPLPSFATFITCMFLHGGWQHLAGNMLYLFIFGDDIEEALGPLRFVLFYLAGGILATLAYFALDVHSKVPVIGASGAISAVLSAYLMLRPCARVTAFVLRVTVRLRAYWVIGGWILLQLYSLASAEEDGVAYVAHLGGLVAGVLLFSLIRPAGVRLFECIDPEQETPAAA